MRLVLALVATALAIAALWIASDPRTSQNGYHRKRHRYQEPTYKRWAVVYTLLAASFAILAAFWPQLTQ